MEQKMNIADFAALVGTTSKTIYGKINNYDNLPVIEQLQTVNERVKGREIKLIVTNSEQIEYYQKLYGKNTVIDGEYYETVTDNNGTKPVSEFQGSEYISHFEHRQFTYTDQLLTLNDYFNDRIEQKNTELMKVYDELSTIRGNNKLLEYKAEREGLYIKEINTLKEEKETLKTENNELILKNNNLERDKKDLDVKLQKIEKTKIYFTFFKWGFIGALFVIVILGMYIYGTLTFSELSKSMKQSTSIERVTL